MTASGTDRGAWERLGDAVRGEDEHPPAPAGWAKVRRALGQAGAAGAAAGSDRTGAEAGEDPGAGATEPAMTGLPGPWADLRAAMGATAGGGRSAQAEAQPEIRLEPVAGEPVAGRGRRRRLVVGAAAAAAAAVTVAVAVVLASGGGGGLGSGAVFAVDGHTVRTADFTAELQARQTLYGIQAPATTDTAKYHAYLTSAAQAEAVSLLLDQVAPRQGIAVSAQSAQASLDQAISTQYGGDRSAFASALGAAGLNQAQVLTEISHNLVYQKLFSKIVGTPSVSDAQIHQYFAQHTADLAVPETRQISHIVVSTQSGAQSLLAQLKGGASFAALASAQSLDTSTRSGGGALGNYAKADLQASFATAAFSAAVNLPFGPVQEQTGWDVGLVTAIHPARPATLDPTTSAAIKTVLTDQAQASAWDAWLGGQIRNAHIAYAAAYRPAQPDQPPQIPIPQLTGETLAGVGPASTTAGGSGTGASSPGAGAGGAGGG